MGHNYATSHILVSRHCNKVHFHVDNSMSYVHISINLYLEQQLLLLPMIHSFYINVNNRRLQALSS